MKDIYWITLADMNMDIGAAAGVGRSSARGRRGPEEGVGCRWRRRAGSDAGSGPGAVSKPALEHVIMVNLAMNFPEINRSGGSRGFVAGRIVLHLYPLCKVPVPLPLRRLSLVGLGGNWSW